MLDVEWQATILLAMPHRPRRTDGIVYGGGFPTKILIHGP